MHITILFNKKEKKRCRNKENVDEIFSQELARMPYFLQRMGMIKIDMGHLFYSRERIKKTRPLWQNA